MLDKLRSHRKEILFILGMYFFFALLYAFVLYYNAYYKDWRYFPSAFLDYAVKGFYSIPVWWIGVRMMRHQPTWQRYLIHLVLAPIWVFLFIKTYYFLCETVGLYHLEDNAQVWDMYYPLLFYIIQFGVFHLYDEVRRSAKQAQKEIELREIALQSELTAIKAQLNPHFLYNVFNTINASLSPKEEYGRELVAKLSDLFRYQLKASKKAFVPLEQEIDFIYSYLELEEARFRERLQVKWEVDQSLMGVSVPPMLLQPIIENAIQHGISPKIEGGTVTIRIQQEGEEMAVSIIDDGVGFPDISVPVGEGVGLANTRKMLDRLYGKPLQIQPVLPHGTKVQFSIPIHSVPVPLAL